MGWTLIIILVSACMMGTSSGQESKTSEYEVTSASREVPENIIDWFASFIGPINDPTMDPTEDCPPCECGVATSRRRIVGGQETKVLQFPWMALLLINSLLCGGSLINDYYILTAAHCVYGVEKDNITVRLLEHDRSKPNETTTIDRKVSAIICHPEYISAMFDNDIALLKLDERVYLSNAPMEESRRDAFSEDKDVGIRPVCLASPDLSYAGYDGVVSGWGRTEENGPSSNTLQEVYVPIISNEDCRKTGNKDRITDNMLCAGYPEGGKDACKGDSGGPLHIRNNDTNQYQEVGIVSWGEGCARPDYPGVYTRVNRYLSWIERNTKDACYCQSHSQ